MKRIVPILLCIVLLLAACGTKPPTGDTSPSTGTPTTEPNTTTLPTEEPEETQPQDLQLPMSAVFMPLIAEAPVYKDDVLVYSSTYQEISLTIPNADCAEAVIMDLLGRIDEMRVNSEDLKNWALEEYQGQEYWMPYSTEVIYSPVRIDEKVLSLHGANFSFSGGVHPNYACISANYDLVTGKYLKLEDVLIDKVAADTLCQKIIDKLAEMAEEYYLYDDYIRTVDERFGTLFDPAWESTDYWYLSGEGLCVYFSPYEIAPYASGTIEVTFTYEELDGLIHPDFVPAALPEGTPGTVEAVLAQDVDLDSFTQSAEAIMDAEGEQVVLYTDGMVSGLTLEYGTWDEDGVYFSPKATVFAANTLTPGDAIMLQTMFSDTMPHLRLRYTSDGEEFTYFLFQSGKDGSILLLDETE